MRHSIKRYANRHSGFSLVEIAMVLVIAGIAFSMVMTATRGSTDAGKRALIRSQLDAIDAALANFVAQNKRLPCPANGTLASSAAGAGTETLSPGPPPAALPPKGSCNPINQINGVVPWVSLGLSEADATDPWGARITYRVDSALAQGAPQAILMDMSSCDPSSTGGGLTATGCKVAVPPCAGNGNCSSPSEFLLNKGLDVWDGINGVAGWNIRQNNRGAGTGAAYVLISHGASGTGAYNKSGVLQPGSIAAGTDETPNRNNRALAIPSLLANTYRDAALNDVVSAAHFDDYLSHPKIMTVLNRAALGPRAH